MGKSEKNEIFIVCTVIIIIFIILGALIGWERLLFKLLALIVGTLLINIVWIFLKWIFKFLFR